MKKKIFLLTLLTVFTLVIFSCTKKETLHKVEKIYDYVLDVGTYTSLEYKIADEYANKKFDLWGGGCTAVAKYTDDDKMLVGRNLDLYISNKPAYISRTDIEGEYKTIGLTYFNGFGPDYEEALKGLTDLDYKILPFISTDVFNEKGLFVEINMRNGEYWSNGETEFGCSGTNKDSDMRVCSSLLPRIIGGNCATVDEAIELVKKLDIYTPNIPHFDWNFCFLLADRTGNYGVLEIAQNEISWLPKEPAQTNFYLTPLFRLSEDLTCGMGRYDTVMARRNDVKNEKDMYELMKRVSYSKVYDPDTAGFDVRTEFAALKNYWTYDVITNDLFKDMIMDSIKKDCEKYQNKTRQELQDMNDKWESTFTEVVNCTDLTWFIRFFEDEERTITLTFDK